MSEPRFTWPGVIVIRAPTMRASADQILVPLRRDMKLFNRSTVLDRLEVRVLDNDLNSDSTC